MLFVRSVSFFSVSKCFVLFYFNFFLLVFFSLSSTYAFFAKSAVSSLVANSVCTDLTAKLPVLNFLSSSVVIYLS